MLNFSHGSGLVAGRAADAPAPAFDGSQITAAIDRGIAAAAAMEPRRAYIGASEIGDPCLRKIYYRAVRAPAREPEGRIRRIWLRGHAAEARIVSWLRQAGFLVLDRDPRTGKQLRFTQAGGRFSGGVDGIITAGHLPLPYPLLLEIKCLNRASWSDLVKHGLAVSKEVYHHQIHCYMAYFDLTNCLFCAENADTMELFFALIPLDMTVAQQATDRAVQLIRMIDAGEVPPRVAVNRDHFLCRMCEFSETGCWRETQC